jgi:hypothetical protein
MAGAVIDKPLIIIPLEKHTLPPPKPVRKWPIRLIYPFDQMEVGDTLEINRSPQAVYQAVLRYRKRCFPTAGSFKIWKKSRDVCVVQKISDLMAPVKKRKGQKAKTPQISTEPRKRGRPRKEK